MLVCLVRVPDNTDYQPCGKTAIGDSCLCSEHLLSKIQYLTEVRQELLTKITRVEDDLRYLNSYKPYAIAGT
jgi:hypothetical protein